MPAAEVLFVLVLISIPEIYRRSSYRNIHKLTVSVVVKTVNVLVRKPYNVSRRKILHLVVRKQELAAALYRIPYLLRSVVSVAGLTSSRFKVYLCNGDALALGVLGIEKLS